MKRRQSSYCLAGVAAAWPLAGRAQQPGRLPTIGFLGTTTASAFGPESFLLRADEVFE
jgi:hypothetical protein